MSSIANDIIQIFNWLNLSSSIVALGLNQHQKEMSTRNLPGDKGQPAHKADNFTTICDCLQYVGSSMFTTLRATIKCYRHSFTSPPLLPHFFLFYRSCKIFLCLLSLKKHPHSLKFFSFPFFALLCFGCMPAHQVQCYFTAKYVWKYIYLTESKERALITTERATRICAAAVILCRAMIRSCEEVRSDACSPRDLCFPSPLIVPGFSCPAKHISTGKTVAYIHMNIWILYSVH
jgi:hypothetical protein